MNQYPAAFTYRVLHIFAAFTFTAAALSIGGCVIAIGNRSPESQPGGVPAPEAIRRVPADAQLVAFGREMQFTPPEAGMVYLVEADSGKLLQAMQVAEGEVYRVSSSGVRYAGERYNQVSWSLPFEDHELYFRPIAWEKPQAAEETWVIIVVDGNDRLRLNGEAVTLSELEQRLRSLAQKNRQARVQILGNLSSDMQTAVEVLDAVREAGFEDVTLSTAQDAGR